VDIFRTLQSGKAEAIAAIAKALGIGRASVYRVLEEGGV
jgi:DNA invertase Pin-like site-specific DNA recombinase